MSEVRCPRCVGKLDINSRMCPNADCKFVLPGQYVEDCEKQAPMQLATFGFTQVGKTTHLAAMCAQLSQLRAVARAWKGSWFAANDLARNFSGEALRCADRGERMPPTQTKAEPVTPYMWKGTFEQNIPQRYVLLYDVPGETLTSTDVLRERVPALPHIKCAWFYWQPTSGLQLDEGHTLSSMFERYLEVMVDARQEARGRRAVLIVSRADEFAGVGREFLQHLASDPLGRDDDGRSKESTIAYEAYLDDVRENSARLKDHLSDSSDLPDVLQFLNQVASVGMSLECCLISSTGQPALEMNEFRYSGPWRRLRVLAPALLSLDLDGESRQSGVALLIDPLLAVKPGIGARVEALSRLLGRFGTVSLYGFGSATAVETLSSAQRARVVAPIVMRLPRHVPAVVLCEQPPIDLADLRGLADGRTLILPLGKRIQWLHVADAGDDSAILDAMRRIVESLATATVAARSPYHV